MSLDHHDADAVQRFTEEVDEALAAASPDGFATWTARLVGAWLLGLALITLAVRSDGAVSTVLYLLGLAVVAFWVVGFYSARGERARWFGA
jgi:hypothetical protein